MKKILSFILVFTAVFTLLGCNLDQTSNEKAFKEYLQANKALTVEELDALVTDSEVADMPVDLFTNLKLENIFIDGNYKVKNQLEETDIYLWQNESKIYLASKPQNYEAEAVAYYFDLSALEVLYDEARKESQSEDMKPSEMIDLYLDEVIASTAMPLDIDLETILGVVSLNFDDFTSKDTGEYVLKNEVLFEKIAILSGMPDGGTELEKQFEEMGIDFSFTLYFDGKNLTGYVLNIFSEIENQSINFKINLLYEDVTLIGYSIVIDLAEEGKLELSVKFIDETLTLDAKITSNNVTLPSSLSISISKNKFFISMKENDIEELKCDLELINNKLGDITSFGIKGSIKVVDSTDGIIYSALDINITSGDAVIIPDYIKELESIALNGIDELSQNYN